MDGGGVLFPRHVHLVDIVCGIALEEGIIGILVVDQISGCKLEWQCEGEIWYWAYHAFVGFFCRNGIVSALY